MANRENLTGRAVLLAAAAAVLLTGCPKKPVIKPAAGEIISRSYTVRTYGYRMNFAVKASPQEIENYFIKNLSWISNLSARLSLKIIDQSHGRDMSLPGSYVDTELGYYGFKVPCRVVNLKYQPEKELWLMLTSGDGWTILRLELKPAPAGSLITMVTIGSVPESAAKIMEGLEMAKSAASQMDYAMAVIQNIFDPSLDPKKLTEKGLRGQLFEKPFTVYESETWVNMAPQTAVNRGLQQDNFIAIMDSSEVDGFTDCMYAPENRAQWDPAVKAPGTKSEFIYCPDTTVKVAGFNWKTETFAAIKPQEPQNFFNFYITTANILVQLQLQGKPDNGGARVWLRLIVEPPAGNFPNLMDLLMTITGLPQWTEELLTETIKRIQSPS